MRKGDSSSVKALFEKTGWTWNPSPTQCLGAAGKICLTERRATEEVDMMLLLLLLASVEERAWTIDNNSEEYNAMIVADDERRSI
jgi:hypothetical protein